MTTASIVLVGGPDTGKTNFIGRLWLALRNGESTLRLGGTPDEIKYVEDAVGHLHRGQFAPRTDQNVAAKQSSITIPLARRNAAEGDDRQELVVPDVSGEIWKAAVETRELSRERMKQLEDAAGAVVFVRVLSRLNVSPPDWVNSAALMQLQEDADVGEMPTQVMLCEFVRFLELKLRAGMNGRKPRVAVVVTAWDLLDAERGAVAPRAYLEREYPLFAGRLNDVSRFEIGIFSMSILGGDPGADKGFRARLLDEGLESAGYVRYCSGNEIRESADVGLPIAWAIQEDEMR